MLSLANRAMPCATLVILSCAACVRNHYDYLGRPVVDTPHEEKYRKVFEHLREAQKLHYRRDRLITKVPSALYRLSPADALVIYQGVDIWQLPEETENCRCGDCEDLAIWLYERLLADGIDNVRLFIGRYREFEERSHAWVVWFDAEGEVYILDPAGDEGVWPAKYYPPGFYRPEYSFDLEQSYIHP